VHAILDQFYENNSPRFPWRSGQHYAGFFNQGFFIDSRADRVLTMRLTILIAEATGERLIGFVESDLCSHADGCNPAQAVGYLEGWYVAEQFRHRGVGML